jgi:hypothetical protein
MKKCSEINLGNLETLKNLDKAEKTNIKDSIEEELYLFCKPISSSSNKNKKEKTIKDEINLYNALKIENSDFSSFWANNHKKFPILSKLVKFVCCSPPTSVPSERDFSMGTDIVTPKRNKLSEKRIEYLSFLRRNLDKVYE